MNARRYRTRSAPWCRSPYLPDHELGETPLLVDDLLTQNKPRPPIVHVLYVAWYTIYQPTLRTAIHRCDRLELAHFPRGSLSMVFTALRSIATTIITVARSGTGQRCEWPHTKEKARRELFSPGLDWASQGLSRQ